LSVLLRTRFGYMEDKAIGTPFPAERVAVMSGTSSALRPIISRRVYFQRCSGGSRHQKGSARAFSTWAGLIRRLARQVEGKGSLLFVTMAERVGFEPTVPCGTHAFQACALSHSAISPGP
jgi:hypothetical protein